MAEEFNIDRIVCINHPDALRRLETMRERFRRHSIQAVVSPGVVPEPGQKPFIGCLKAHQLAIANAKKDKLKNILIFEDDVVFTEDWSWIKEQLKDLPEDYDILRLCIVIEGCYKREHVKGHIFRCWNAYGTQCYLVNEKAFDKILSFPETDPYDDQLNSAGFIEYAIHPLPLYHELGTSLLGNLWQQTREDLWGKDMSRAEAVAFLDALFQRFKAPYNTHMRIIQALQALQERPLVQEIRFLKNLLEPVEMNREQAIEVSRALFALQLEDLSSKKNS